MRLIPVSIIMVCWHRSTAFGDVSGLVTGAVFKTVEASFARLVSSILVHLRH